MDGLYGWLWRHLPGPTRVRVLLVLVMLVAAFLLLMEVVFPWVAEHMPYNDVAV